jgi:hypothetical protein
VAQWGNEWDPTKSNGNPNLAVGFSGAEDDGEGDPDVRMWAWAGSGVSPGLQPTQDERKPGTRLATWDGALAPWARRSTVDSGPAPPAHAKTRQSPWKDWEVAREVEETAQGTGRHFSFSPFVSLPSLPPHCMNH